MRRSSRMRSTRVVSGTLFALTMALACAKSQAYKVGPSGPGPSQPLQTEVVEVVDDLPPFTFEPSVLEQHRGPQPQQASMTALPRMVRSTKCINAGAVIEGRSSRATKSTQTRWRRDKKSKGSKAKAKPKPQQAPPMSPDDDAPEAELEPAPTAAPSGGASMADSIGGEDLFKQDAESGADAPPNDPSIAIESERKKLKRNQKKAERKANREQRKLDKVEKRAGKKSGSALAPSSAPPPAGGVAYEQQPPPQRIIHIPPEMPPTQDGWGQPLYVSNDDSMSLSSAQRVAFAVEKFQPLAPGDVRPHELLNWAFGNVPASTNADRDFAVEGDVLSHLENGTHTMALAVHGRRVGRSGRRHAALTLVVDQSGSMKREGRMNFVRRGLLRMVRELKKGDIVNLVTFDNKVCPRLTNFVVGRDNAEILNREILRIKPRGATNLHAGLKQGYALADTSYQPRYSNRVLLITDALANRGVTDARTLGMVSDSFDARRIRLSGVGVGKEFNDKLLDTLTEKGRGAYVFLGSEKVVDQVFGDRFVSLVETIANDVHFRLHLPPTLRVQQFHGEEASTSKREVQAVHFFADTSQVLLVDVEPWKGELRSEDDVMLEIEYQNPETGELRIEEHVIHLSDAIGSGRGYAANGKLVLAFADGLQTLARRPPPRGFEARVGGWPDAGALRVCADVRDGMLAIADATWQRTAVDVWDRFCARYSRSNTRRPTRKR